MSEQLPSFAIASDSDSQQYWEGIARGELRIQRCDACSRAVFYPRAICPHCFSNQLSWIVATGRGTIYTYTVAHQAFGLFASEVPFVVALVELEEGVRMMTRIIDAPRERIAIGAPVHVTFTPVNENVTLPYFRLDE
ncbi:MAG TPA: Zn-ribbon domain-containing OB-fold protein [Ktedonobacteraceae bacterium]|nr:Zn-ribbon domain-containing OB-fold protein [Ktedonobacteraceae bacterium]